MKKEIEWMEKTRSYLLDLIKDLTTEQLNKIPAGFNNNIIWNLGHLIASQQGLCYTRSGLSGTVDETFFASFRTQTKPERFITDEEVTRMKELFLSTLIRLKEDYSQNTFTSYTAFTTRYGVELTNIDHAIDFLVFHEGLHTGYIMALKRLIK